ncbi:hypothetical protein BDF14DRAFT_1740020 [Spinellus fusiger]|nr:hypothetical protein BDF14DRAFT_1740020 [Spinellus fusiger]
MSLQCAYIGLGAMGYSIAGHIAKNLQEQGHPELFVYNRTQTRAESLKETHPVKVASLEECAKADVIFSCLLNDSIVETVITGLISSGLKKGAIIVEQSTVAPTLVDSLAQKAKEHGVIYLSCPIMGPPAFAASANLLVLLAGPKEGRAIVKPLLIPVIGKKFIDLSEDPAQGSRLKLCGNFFITGLCEMIAEGLTLGEASGISEGKVGELLNSMFPQTVLSIYSSRMIEKTYNDQVHFSLTGAKKDATHVLKMGEAYGVDLPVTRLFLDNLESAKEKKGDIDLTGIVGSVREKAGLEFDLKSTPKQ